MAYKADVRTTFEPERVVQPLYTGGAVALSRDGRTLATTLGEEALLTDLDTGAHLARVEGDGEPITTLTLSPDGGMLVVCSRSLSMRVYAVRGLDGDEREEVQVSLLRTLKPHAAPVVTIAVDETGALLATGGADGVVKVWDLRGGFATHTFHHGGLVSALTFFRMDPTGAEGEEKAGGKRKMQSTDRGIDQTEEVQDPSDQATAGYRLASGGEDGKVRVWDLHRRKTVAVLDSHVSVVRSIDYSAETGLLLSASRDKTAILWHSRSWALRTTIPVLEGVESAGFLKEGSFFYTAGETARLRVWETSTGHEVTEKQAVTMNSAAEGIVDVLGYEGLPWVLSVHADQTLVLHSIEPLLTFAAGPGASPLMQPLPVIRRISGTHDEIIDIAYIGRASTVMALATNSDDIRLISLEMHSSQPSSNPSSNLPAPSTTYFGADIARLTGHTDIVIALAIDWSGHWLATGAKDHTARLWRLDPEHNSYTCHATFTGHAESISAVALPSASPAAGSDERAHPLAHPPRWMLTGSQDKTVKRWAVPNGNVGSGKAAYTRKAHDKDINALATSYSVGGALFASASQDRTVKVWDAGSGEAVGVLRGHRRGVWSVAFAPPGMALTTGEAGAASGGRGVVVTGSADKTVRIWSLGDYSCLRTFEGHSGSVLKVLWLPVSETGERRGVQVASAAGDGLVKVWDAQTGECAATLDNHTDRVWALAVKPPPPRTEPLDSKSEQRTNDDDVDMDSTSELPPNNDTASTPPLTLVSGSADSTLTFWTDTSASTAHRASTRTTARIEQDQALQNSLRAGAYRDALALALQLDHPRRLLDLFTAVADGARDDGSLTGRRDVDDALAALGDAQLWALLTRVRDWNANARSCRTAQRVLYALLKLHGKARILGLRGRRRGGGVTIDGSGADGGAGAAMPGAETLERGSRESVRDVLDGLRAYTERHWGRVERLGAERWVLVWALEGMGGVGGGAVGGVGAVNAHLEGGDAVAVAG